MKTILAFVLTRIGVLFKFYPALGRKLALNGIFLIIGARTLNFVLNPRRSEDAGNKERQLVTRKPQIKTYVTANLDSGRIFLRNIQIQSEIVCYPDSNFSIDAQSATIAENPNTINLYCNVIVLFLTLYILFSIKIEEQPSQNHITII